MLMRRQNTGYCDGLYSVSAGHVESDELPLGGLVRETLEELGISIDPKDAHLAHTMYRTKHDETGDRVDLFFVVEKWSGEITNAEPHKCDDIGWFPINNLPDKIMPHVRYVIEKIENGVIYSELNTEDVKKISNT